MAELSSSQKRVFAQDIGAWTEMAVLGIVQDEYLSAADFLEVSCDPSTSSSYVVEFMKDVVLHYERETGNQVAVNEEF